MDLENDAEFKASGAALINLAVDPLDELLAVKQEYGFSTPILSDGDKKVSETYGVMQWATASGEPSHTFVLIGADGKIKWIQDYGAAENGGRMYVPVDELMESISANLK